MSTIDPEKMDSNEEREFYEWLLEAEKAGLVSDIEYQTASFTLSDRASIKIEKQLKTKIKMVDKFLLHPHKYTPDFIFVWHGWPGLFTTCQNAIWVDVKGTFNKHGDPKQFSINQKWMFSKYGIYVNKVVPEPLFQKTWVPEACRYTPVTRVVAKPYIGVKTIDEYLGVPA